MAEDGIFLSWNNHRSAFCHMLATLREEEMFTDVTVSCEGKFYPLHKLVLSTCSDYFQKMLELTPCRHPFIVIKGIQDRDMEALLSYMYTGSVVVTQSDLPTLIEAAKFLQVKGFEMSHEVLSNSPPYLTTVSDDSSQSQEQRAEDQFGKPIPLEELDEVNIADGSRTGDRKPSVYYNSAQKTNNILKVKHEYHTTCQEVDEAEVESPSQLCHISHTESLIEEDIIKEEMMEDLDTSENQEPAPCNGSPRVLAVNKGRQILKDEVAVPCQDQEYSEYQPCIDGRQSASASEVKMGPSDHEEELFPPDSEFGHSPYFTVSKRSRKIKLSNFSRLKDGKYCCSLCSYKTTFKSKLSVHLRTHTGERPYTCSECSFTAASEYSVKVHMRVHTGEKPFKCSRCSLRFSQKAHLSTHLFTHTGEKPFSCLYCSTKFSRRSNLRRHIQKNH